MAQHPPGGPPPTRPIREALDQSATLLRLFERVQASNARFEAIRPALPAALRRHVQPGPLDEEGWALLAANGAVAAKLRQLLPRLLELLQEAGLETRAIRVRVLGG